jgi:hypothetical protein
LEKVLNMNFICKEIQNNSYGVIGGTLKVNPVTWEKICIMGKIIEH